MFWPQVARGWHWSTRQPFPGTRPAATWSVRRGLQVLADLGIPMPAGRDVGDMVVAGPTGRLVHLPCAEGLTYPGHGTAVTRTVFDAALHEGHSRPGPNRSMGGRRSRSACATGATETARSTGSG